jgi:hypothetical protein
VSNKKTDPPKPAEVDELMREYRKEDFMRDLRKVSKPKPQPREAKS